MRRSLALVLALASALPACAPAAPPPAADSNLAPAFTGVDLRGQRFDLADLRGRVVLLNVWATWCEPCREELPELQALQQRHGADGLVVVGVSIDAARAEREVRRLVAAARVTYPIVLDPKSTIVPPFKVVGYPTTFLIDRQGAIRWRRDGLLEPGDPDLAAALAAALAG